MNEKRCARCREVRGLQAFCRDRSRKDGLCPVCRFCQKRERDARRLPGTGTRTCQHCNRPFTSVTPRPYCSSECRLADFPDRFWDRVDRSGGCWIWTKGRSKHGYGELRLLGKHHLAHRVAWELANGVPIPDGLDVLHKCDNPPCCNPSHLFVGTHADNVADMVAKGRSASGEQHSQARLTWDEVRELRRRVSNGEDLRDVAKSYGLGTNHARKIVDGELWREDRATS